MKPNNLASLGTKALDDYFSLGPAPHAKACSILRGGMCDCGGVNLLHQARTELAALLAENARMREALTDLVEQCDEVVPRPYHEVIDAQRASGEKWITGTLTPDPVATRDAALEEAAKIVDRYREEDAYTNWSDFIAEQIRALRARPGP